MLLALLLAGVALPAGAARADAGAEPTVVARKPSTSSTESQTVQPAARPRPISSVYTGSVSWRQTQAIYGDSTTFTQWKGIVEFTLNPKKSQTYPDGSRYYVYDLTDGLVSEYRHTMTLDGEECTWMRNDPSARVAGGILEITQTRSGKRTYTFDVDLDLGMQPNGCGWDQYMVALANVRRTGFKLWPVKKKDRLIAKKATDLYVFTSTASVGAASWRLTPSVTRAN